MDPSKPGRGTARFLASLPASLHAASGVVPCEAHDLSRSGVLLIGAISAEPGDRVRLTLRSTAGDLAIEVGAVAVRFEPGLTPAEAKLALAFEDLDDQTREGLEVLVSRVVEGTGPTPLDSLPPNTPQDQVRAVLDKIPLSHRVGLAARANPRERALLLHDGNPQVIEALARNPQLLATEVRALLRLPHLLPSTIELLARDARWRRQEDLRVAIAAHPSATLPVGESIVETLSRDGMQKLLRQGALSEPLRRKILLKLSPRR